MSELQVLISTMDQKDYSICSKMNINSDAIVINQSDSVAYHKYSHNGFDVDFYTFREQGLSRSRNEALMRSSADIICIADDDMVYTDTYREDILNEFSKHPEADAIAFNVESINVRNLTSITRYERIGKIEYKEYCSVNLAFRREKLLYKNMSFNTMFGSGSEYSCGEDTIFMKELMDKGFHIYKSPLKIAKIDMSGSTWFNGYNEKFFHDKGALIGATYPRLSYILVFLQSLKNSKRRLGSYRHFRKVFDWYMKGLKDYKKKVK